MPTRPEPRSGERAGSGALGFIAAVAAVAVAYFLRPVLVPLVIAFVLVVLVDALVQLVARRLPRAPGWAAALVAGTLVIVTAAVSIFVLAQGTVRMLQRGSAVAERLESLAQSVGRTLHLSQPLHLNAIIAEPSARQLAGHILSSVEDVAPTVLLIVVYFSFMLAGRKRIQDKFAALAGSRRQSERIRTISARIAANIRTYIWVQALTGAMRTACAALVILAVGLDYPLFWIVAIFLLTFIPEIGITIASIAAALYALIQFSTVWQALLIFGVIQASAFIIGNFIYPRMQAKTQNIDPIAMILALSFWTLLWGIPGAFLAVPMTIMLILVLAQFEGTHWIAGLLSNDGPPQVGGEPAD